MSIVLGVLDALINTLWQAVLIALAVTLLLRFAPGINAATRYAIWWATLGIVLLLPLGPRVVTLVPQHPTAATKVVRARGGDAAEPLTENVLVKLSPSPTAVWPRVAFSIWAAVLIWRLAAILRSYFWLRGVKARAQVAPIMPPQTRRRFAVLVSREIRSPMAAGFVHPAILLPDGLLEELPVTEQQHVLLHEASHLDGYDDWTNLGMRVVGGVLALHPVAIWILGQIEREREMVCDAWVVSRTGAARAYAESLMHLMELTEPNHGPALAVGLFGGKSRIGRRIEALLEAGRTVSARVSRGGTLASVAGLCVLMFAGSLAPRWIALAQGPTVPDWQTKAGGKMAFDVASVKPVKPGGGGGPPFPLDSGDAYKPTGGRFYASMPVFTYIQFAYKFRMTPDQRTALYTSLPKEMAMTLFDNYAIEAKAPLTNPTKDQMRLMMQSLLAERFHLALHFETQTLPAFAMVLAKPGKLGPQLRPHEQGPPCDPPSTDKQVFPPRCDEYWMERQRDGQSKVGSRNTTMDRLAEMIPTFGTVRRPVVDRTGLSGSFDFKLEWRAEVNGSAPPNPDVVPEPLGPTLLEAISEQLGLKLESTKAPVQVMVLDHLEKASAN